jgi:SAM-dependent methyltransferase
VPLNPDVAYAPERYWEDGLERRFDVTATGFPHLALSWNRWLYRAMRDSVERVLRAGGLRGPLAGRDVLDVGCGVGAWLAFWRERAPRSLSGIDITATAVQRLRGRFPGVELVQADIGAEEPPFARCFDVISVIAVLQHVTDDERFARALAHLERMLAPGGAIVFTDALIAHRYIGQAKPPGAISWARSRAEWERALAAAGLQIRTLVPTTFLLAPAGDTRSVRAQRALDRYWNVVGTRVGADERRGALAGAAAYGVDCALVRSGLGGVSSKTFLVSRHQ